jgi:2,3-bisphosphoglycerate-dependent phosphoglycerate mutase|tara:strand:+ start:6323 stop:7045 length:723 start_codon:yes stop_codon:yes gene_type:complete
MSYLIIVRHGQSEWNAQKRFTGWVDVDLTAEGKLEACKAGELIKEINVKIDNFFSSYQKRAINTLELIMDTIRIKPNKMIKAWELNERHYGDLTGLNKDEMKKKYGDKKIHTYRRSWKIAPPSLSKNNPYHPINIDTYKNIPREKIPDTESLKNTYDRTVPYYKKNIENLLMKKKNIIIAAHGNSIRALCKYLLKLSDKKISELEIPTGNPLIINFDKKLKISNCYYLDNKRKKDLLVNF